MEIGRGSRIAIGTGTHRNKGQGKRRRGSSRGRKKHGLGGARTQREQMKKTEMEREAKGQRELSPSLPGCLSARLGSATPKPLLKLLHVGA